VSELTSNLRQNMRKALWLPVILGIAFMLESVFGELPLLDRFLYLSTVLIVSIVVIILSMTWVQDMLGITETIKQIKTGLDEVKHVQTVAISNEVLKDIESRARRVRIISPDLYADRYDFYEVILSNINNGIVYEYIIPQSDAIKSRMEWIRRKLCEDTGLASKELPVKFITFGDFPIVTEYMIYEVPNSRRLDGYMEIRIGPHEQDTTNVLLTEKDTHYLNGWFDRMFDAT